MYGKLDQAKLFALTQALSELKQGNLLVTTCFNWLSALWNELEATKEQLEGPKATLRQYHEMKEREKVMRFLLILNDTYSIFRSQVLVVDPMLSLNRIYQLAVQEESQRLAAAEHGRIESIALGAVTESPYRSIGSTGSIENVGSQGHLGSIRLQRAALEEDRNPKGNRVDGQDRKAGSNGHYLIFPSAESSGSYGATSTSTFKPSNGSRGAT